ncbi:MAG: trypsin-like peptidase domain-containing protein [Candidatus Komeilibacteria bacterium]|nr:trypsin-like peptidase domain-containing protein [Candidatus Komeilibacteria bacterium]
MFWQDLSSTFKKVLIITIIISVVGGGLVGGVLGSLGAVWAGSRLAPWLGQTLPGVPPEKKDQTIIEDSATVDVVARSTGAVVSIIISQDLSKLYNQTNSLDPFGGLFFNFPGSGQIAPQGKQQVGGGTGFIITTDGLIVTNRHVVDQMDAEYTVVLNDGKKFPAEVLARDTVNDVAVIRIKADNLPVLDLGDSDAVKIGQTVIAIGNSLGEFSNTITKGIISGINRRVVASDSSGSSEIIEEAIQTDAAINPGNSGGPLLDLFGKVVGMNTAVSQAGQLIGFAIPINAVKNVITSVQKYGRIIRTFLGVRYILLTEEIAKQNNITGIRNGALIVRGAINTELAITPGSPADKAGLVENDIILEVNGEPVTIDKTLTNLLNKYKPEDKVKLKVYHKGEVGEVEVILTERK